MPVSAPAAASAAASIINLHHNHKKAVQLDSAGSSVSTEPVQPHATTQGLFSRLLKTVEQVAGVSPLASAAVAAVKAVTTSTPTATSALGTKVDINV